MSHDNEEMKKIIEEVIDEKLEPFQPMLKLYNEASGFTNVTLTIFKTLLIVGAGVGLIYGFIKWLKS